MNELLLSAVSLAAGFGLGWSLRGALARADKTPDFDRFPVTMILEPEEIIDLKWQYNQRDTPIGGCAGPNHWSMKEQFKARGDRS